MDVRDSHCGKLGHRNVRILTFGFVHREENFHACLAYITRQLLVACIHSGATVDHQDGGVAVTCNVQRMSGNDTTQFIRRCIVDAAGINGDISCLSEASDSDLGVTR